MLNKEREEFEEYPAFVFDTERRILRDKRVVVLCDSIHRTSAKDFVEDIEILASVGTEPITIIIASDGGDVSPGLACIRAITKAQSKGIKVIGEVHGHAMSMAFFILQWCDWRTMGKLCTLMAHGVTTFTIGDIRNIEAERKLLQYWRKEFSKFLAKRCTVRDSKYATEDFWLTILEDATPQFYDSEECLTMGLIDEVK